MINRIFSLHCAAAKERLVIILYIMHAAWVSKRLTNLSVLSAAHTVEVFREVEVVQHCVAIDGQLDDALLACLDLLSRLRNTPMAELNTYITSTISQLGVRTKLSVFQRCRRKSSGASLGEIRQRLIVQDFRSKI